MLQSIGYWFLMIAVILLLLLIVANVIYTRVEKRNKGIYKSTKKIMEKDGKLK